MKDNKKIIVFDVFGKPLKVFKNAAAGIRWLYKEHKKLIALSTIITVARRYGKNNKTPTAGGFIWRFYDDVVEKTKKKKMTRKEKLKILNKKIKTIKFEKLNNYKGYHNHLYADTAESFFSTKSKDWRLVYIIINKREKTIDEGDIDAETSFEEVYEKFINCFGVLKLLGKPFEKAVDAVLQIYDIKIIDRKELEKND